MNRLLIKGVILTGLLFTSSVIHAAALQRPPNNLGLMGYWSFNEGVGTVATDFSGNGNTGSVGGPLWDSKGKRGSALNFDGSNDQVATANGNSVKGLTQATLSLWFRPDRLNGTAQVLYAESVTASAATGRFRLRIDSDDKLIFHGKAPDSDGTTIWVDSSTALATSTWYHAVAVFDSVGDVQHLYINGVDQSASVTEVAFETTDPAAPPRIGRNPDGANSFLGLIDEVRVYNRALTSTEVAALYNSGAAIIKSTLTRTKINASQNDKLTSGLVGNWSFNGADLSFATNLATDRSSNNNSGRLTNMATDTAPVIGKVGQALDFDGADDRVVISADPIATGADSVCAWIYPRTLGETSEGRIAGNENSYMYIAATDHLVFTSNNSTLAVSANSSITLNKWQHVCATRDASGTANLYIDGTLSGSANQSSGSPSAGTAVQIGNIAATTKTFDGYIDEIRLYSQVLTAAEVKQLYLMGR
ncbi:LamG domain-containing protein [Candidatus Parcubacteria bacterium]|nr:LamG domain-containing protein [Candidatus Parcubacteria bacterium]